MFTVQVFYENNKKPAKDKRVSICIDGLFSGGCSREQWTNADGRACIDLGGDRKWVKGEIYIDGYAKYKGHVEKFMVVYI